MRAIKHLTNEEIQLQAYRVSRAIVTDVRLRSALATVLEPVPLRLYGVPRGGVPTALALVNALAAEFPGVHLVDDPDFADVIVDDIVDSGKTRDRYLTRYPGKPFYALIEATGASPWYVFPWENSTIGSAEDIVIRLLQFIGEDPKREGLRETPARVLKAWQEWTEGYKSQDPKEILKEFEDGAKGVDEMVLVRDIPFWSMCEHHLAPFFGTAHVAYIPNGKVVGLSKVVRLVNAYARRLQVQERLTQQVAHAMHESLQPIGVGVIINARHTCMESRGVNRTGSETITSCMLGAMRDSARARLEFLSLAQPKR
jgi:GTP cyclohydrolase IA